MTNTSHCCFVSIAFVYGPQTATIQNLRAVPGTVYEVRCQYLAPACNPFRPIACHGTWPAI